VDSIELGHPIPDMPVSRPGRDSSTLLDRTRTLAGSQVRRLPGGARVAELWTGSDRLTLTASGDLDAFDQHAVINLVTDGVLRGGRHVTVDAREATFIDTAVLRALLRCRHFLKRSGGTLTVSGLRPSLDLVWRLLNGEAPIREWRQELDSGGLGWPGTPTATGGTDE
jgi:anti-anti-sigma regulatory factor